MGIDNVVSWRNVDKPNAIQKENYHQFLCRVLILPVLPDCNIPYKIFFFFDHIEYNTKLCHPNCNFPCNNFDFLSAGVHCQSRCRELELFSEHYGIFLINRTFSNFRTDNSNNPNYDIGQTVSHFHSAIMLLAPGW